MKNKLEDLRLDIIHRLPLAKSGITIDDVKSITIRDEDRGGVPMVCTGIEELPNGELAIFVTRYEGEPKPTGPHEDVAFTAIGIAF